MAPTASVSECLEGASNREEHPQTSPSPPGELVHTAVPTDANQRNCNQEDTSDTTEHQDRKAIEIEDLIAELCLTAPSDPVKFCIRHYQYGKELKKIENNIYTETRPTLIDTADYLLLKFNEKTATKKYLAHEILCRIQNLLPDDCNLCNKRYRINLNDKPLLECEVCFQGVHEPCWTQLIHAKSSIINSLQLEKLNAKELINPLNFPGVHYICQACEPEAIPCIDSTSSSNPKQKSSKNTQKKKQTEPSEKRKTTETAVSSLPKPIDTNEATIPISTTNNVPPNTNTMDNIWATPNPYAPLTNCLSNDQQVLQTNTQIHADPNETSSVRRSLVSQPTTNTSLAQLTPNPTSVAQANNTAPPPPPPPQQGTSLSQQMSSSQYHPIDGNSQAHPPTNVEAPTTTKYPIICRFFKKGSCKHGIKGQSCQFQHPTICEKFTQHGTRKPRGCNLGRSCKDFHPLVCINSLRTGKCFDSTCRFNHIGGTKREPPSITNHQQSVLIPNQQQPPQHHQQSNHHQHHQQSHCQQLNHQSDGRGDQSNQHQSSHNTNHILGAIRLMKAEIMEAMESRMSVLMTKVQSLTTPHHPYPHTYQAQLANNPNNQSTLMQPHIPQQFNAHPSSQLQIPYQQANNVPQPNNNLQTNTTAPPTQMLPNTTHPPQPPSLMNLSFQMPPRVQPTIQQSQTQM